MAGRQIYRPDGFSNTRYGERVTGFSFQFKAQYYRGFTLSILRDIQIEIDGEKIDRKDIQIEVNKERFTLDEARTVVDPDYRWEFGEYATVYVKKNGGLAPGVHHIRSVQIIAPSYMPFELQAVCETDFVMEGDSL